MVSFSFQAQRLLRTFSRQELSNTNLHLIAIHNLKDSERRIERWWSKKYQQPLRAYGEHTMEELIIEYLEDFYENNPQEIEKVLKNLQEEEEWDGQMSPEYEAEMQKRFRKMKKIDLSKFQSDEELTPEQEEEIIRNLGRNLPPRKIVHKTTLGEQVVVDEEFDEKFGD